MTWCKEAVCKPNLSQWRIYLCRKSVTPDLVFLRHDKFMLFQPTRCLYFFSSSYSLYMAHFNHIQLHCSKKLSVIKDFVYVSAKNVNDLFSYSPCLHCCSITFLTVWVNKNKQPYWGLYCLLHQIYGSSADRELVFKFESFLKSEPDICEGGVKTLWLALTTQWGADESVPSRPFPSPRHHIPSLTRCTDIRKKSSGGFAPPPQTATRPPKSTFCTVLRWRAFLFPSHSGLVEPSQWWAVLYRQTKEETTITLDRWSALSGLKRLWWGKAGWGVLHREVSVSWATTLIVCPCPKFPITPHLLPLPIFSSLHWLFTRLLPE